MSSESLRPAPVTGRTETVIQPSRGWLLPDLHELWEYRELLFFLVWRDIKVRYKQTILGSAWAVVQPFFTMVVFSIFFGKLAKVPSDGIPYPLFAFAALVPWNLFATGLSGAANSLVSGGALIRKIYFPRLVIPIASVSSGIVDFLIAFTVLLAVMMPYFGYAPSLRLLVLPGLVLLAMGTALGVGLWLAALNLQFRDVRHTVPFLVQLWLFSTPIAYSSTLLPEKWRPLYAMNPMVGVVEGFRWALVRTDTAPQATLLVSLTMALLLLASGTLYFKRVEKQFADLV